MDPPLEAFAAKLRTSSLSADLFGNLKLIVDTLERETNDPSTGNESRRRVRMARVRTYEHRERRCHHPTGVGLDGRQQNSPGEKQPKQAPIIILAAEAKWTERNAGFEYRGNWLLRDCRVVSPESSMGQEES